MMLASECCMDFDSSERGRIHTVRLNASDRKVMYITNESNAPRMESNTLCSFFRNMANTSRVANVNTG